jgi:ATP-dependent protease Clp ATPase subunit
MPEKKKRKPAHQMTGEEIAKRVFPPAVHEHLKRVANPEPNSKPAAPKSPQRKDDR